MSKKQKKKSLYWEACSHHLWYRAQRQRHAHHGRLSSRRVLHRMGCYLRTIPDCRIHVHQENPE